MDFTDRISQPVKSVHQVWEPNGKVPQKARVEGTFLQAFLFSATHERASDLVS